MTTSVRLLLLLVFGGFVGACGTQGSKPPDLNPCPSGDGHDSVGLACTVSPNECCTYFEFTMRCLEGQWEAVCQHLCCGHPFPYDEDMTLPPDG